MVGLANCPMWTGLDVVSVTESFGPIRTCSQKKKKKNGGKMVTCTLCNNKHNPPPSLFAAHTHGVPYPTYTKSRYVPRSKRFRGSIVITCTPYLVYHSDQKHSRSSRQLQGPCQSNDLERVHGLWQDARLNTIF